MNLEYLFDSTERINKLVQGSMLATVTAGATPTNMLLDEINPAFECPKDSVCFSEVEPTDAAIFIVLNDQIHFADQIQTIHMLNILSVDRKIILIFSYFGKVK